MIRILFCNISYLPYYNTRLDRVAPKNGGAYVAKMHDAYEKPSCTGATLLEGKVWKSTAKKEELSVWADSLACR